MTYSTKKQKTNFRWVLGFLLAPVVALATMAIGPSATAVEPPIALQINSEASFAFTFEAPESENGTVFTLTNGNFSYDLTCQHPDMSVYKWRCEGATETVSARLDELTLGAGWGSLPQFSLKIQDSQSSQLVSLLVHATDLRAVTIANLQISAPQGLVLRGLSTQKITFTAGAINQRGNPLATSLRFELDGQLIFASGSAVSQGSKSVFVKSLSDGVHSLRVESESESGPVEDTVMFTVITPKITKLTLGYPATYYPFIDGYQDALTVNAQINTNTGGNVPGTGSISLQTMSGKVLKSYKVSRTGSNRVVFKGNFLGKLQTGKLKIVASYAPLGGSTSKVSKFVTASPKKLVTLTKKFTVSAWDAMEDCGSSFDPCKKGGYRGASKGIELYSDPIGGDHESSYSVKLPSGTKKWKATFNGLHVEWIAPEFGMSLPGEEDEYGDWIDGPYLGSLPSKANYSGSWTSKWATQSDSGSHASFYLSASDWGTLYFDSITFTCVQKKLQ